MEACREELTVSPEEIRRGGSHYAVAASYEEIIGFYALERLPDESLELRALFIEPRHIGSGVGRVLIEHAVRTAAKGGQQLLIQADPNAAVFYRAVGAELVGMRESGSIPGRFLPVYSISLSDRASKTKRNPNQSSDRGEL